MKRRWSTAEVIARLEALGAEPEEKASDQTEAFLASCVEAVRLLREKRLAEKERPRLTIYPGSLMCGRPMPPIKDRE